MGKMQQDKQEMIDRYLEGHLGGTSLQAFERMLAEDPALAAELQFQKELWAAIRDTKKMGLREVLEEVDFNRSLKKIDIKRYTTVLKLAAAILFIIIVVGSSLLLRSLFLSDSDSQQLFKAYFNPPDKELLTFRSDSPNKTGIEMGMEHFNDQKYKLAVEEFQKIPDDMLATLYTGFCFLYLENYQAAEQEFKKILDHGNSLLNDQAEWYLGLSCLALGKEKDARIIFQKIAKSDSQYKPKATEILAKMKSKKPFSNY